MVRAPAAFAGAITAYYNSCGQKSRPRGFGDRTDGSSPWSGSPSLTSDLPLYRPPREGFPRQGQVVEAGVESSGFRGLVEIVGSLSFTSFLAVAAIALAAPLLVAVAPRLRMPAVVLEIVLGIIVGPSGFGWVAVDVPVRVLALIGLSFLLF